MSAIEKTLVFAGVARNMYGRWRLRRLMTSLAIVAGLVIVSSMLLGTMVIGGFYAGYLALVHYGWATHTALLITTSAFILTTATSVALTINNIRRLQPPQTAGTSRFSDVVDSFFDGLMNEETPRSR